MTLILIRHAAPIVDPSTPPSQWPLSREGRAAARSLSLPTNAYLVASTEPKAVQTLEPAGRVLRDPRFGEIRREGEPFDGDFRELRLTYVEGAAHPLWEPHADAVRRFGEAVDEHLARAGDRPVVVGTHGMVMTVWLSARIGLPSPGPFWSDLRFPDAYAVDLAARTARRIESNGQPETEAS